MASRATNGKGTFTELPSGNVRGRFTVEIDGHVYRPSFTAPSETKCRKLYNQWLKDFDKKPAVERIEIVKNCAEYWLEYIKKPREGQDNKNDWHTYRDYKMYVDRHISPVIGDMKVNEVREFHITKLMANAKTKPTKKDPKGKPLSRSSAQKLLIALNGIFKTAIKNKLCETNPCDEIALPPVSKKKPSVFMANHMKLIVDHMFKHEHGLCIALYLYSGLRPGEGFGLMWSDIDEQNHVFHIRRSLTLVENKDKPGSGTYQITDGTKTDDERFVTYNAALQPLLDKAPRLGMYVMCRNNNGVYTHHTHTTFDKMYYDFFQDLNNIILKKAEKSGTEPDLIPRLTPHKMRHTFATYLRRGDGVNKVDLDEIRELLGHKNISTTQIYDTVDIEDKKAAVAKLPY